MNELLSNAQFKKSDGSLLTVNFSFAHDLPVKPIITPPFKAWFNNDLNKYGLIFTVEDLKKITNLELDKISYHKNDTSDTEDIWLHLEQCYFVIENVQNNIIDEMKLNGVLISFIDNDGKSI